MIKKVLPSDDPILRRKSKPVAKIDKKMKLLIRDLKDTLYDQKDPEGVGLAAPQIGKNVRVFVAKYKSFERVVINPEIVSIGKSEEPAKTKGSTKPKREVYEGCLSLPYYYGPLRRAKKITIKYLNENGEKKQETFEGFQAQIILHEIDHLEGILFVDHLLSEGKPLFRVNGEEWEEVELV